MEKEFYNRIISVNAQRKNRDNNKDYLIQNPEYLTDLFKIALNINDKNHHKALWIIELIAEEQINLLKPYVEDFCFSVNKFEKNHSKRPASKICMLLVKSKKTVLTAFQKEKIIETCLDWLINPEVKIAPKAYGMYTLSYLIKEHEWLNDALKQIINKDFANQSVGYKAASKEILRRIE